MDTARASSTQEFVSGGLWVGQQFTRHGLRPEVLRPCADSGPDEIRASALLTRDSWEHFNRMAVEAAQERLRAFRRPFERGLTDSVTNALGRTLYTYEQVSDMTPAQASMDPAARSVTGRRERTPVSVPMPVVHKDFDLGLREIRAHQDRGEPLPSSHVRHAGRMVAEGLEDLILNGGPQVAGNSLYGYTNHPNRNTAGFGTNGAWDQAAKTGENILADVLTMIAGSEADNYFGPYDLYVSGAYSAKLRDDFKTNSDKSILQRIEEVDAIDSVQFVDRLSAGVVLVQMTSDVIEVADGEAIQTVQWDIEGGFRVGFKVMALQVPIVKSDAAGGSGIFHMS